MQLLILILKLKCVFPGIEPEKNEASSTFCLAQVSKCASKNTDFWQSETPNIQVNGWLFLFFHELSDAIPAFICVKQPVHVHHVSIPRIITPLSFLIIQTNCFQYLLIWCVCVQCLGLRNHLMKYVTSYVVKLGNHVREWWETYQQNTLWRRFC